MSRGNGTVMRRVLGQLTAEPIRVDHLADVVHDVPDDRSPNRAEVESVRRAVKRLHGQGLVHLQYRPDEGKRRLMVRTPMTAAERAERERRERRLGFLLGLLADGHSFESANELLDELLGREAS